MSVVRSSSTVSLPPPFLLPPLFHHPYPPHHPPPPVTLISTTGQRFNGADSDRQPRRSNAHHTTPPPTSTYWTRLRTAKKIAVPDRPAAAQRPKGVNGGGGGKGVFHQHDTRLLTGAAAESVWVGATVHGEGGSAARQSAADEMRVGRGGCEICTRGRRGAAASRTCRRRPTCPTRAHPTRRCTAARGALLAAPAA